VSANQFPKAMLQLRKLRYEVLKIVRTRYQRKAIYQFHGGNRQRMVIFVFKICVPGKALDLLRYPQNGLLNAVPVDINPRQPQMSFVVENGLINPATFYLRLQFLIAEIKVSVHGYCLKGGLWFAEVNINT